MLTYPIIDPVAFHIGPIQIHWYGIMYLLGFSAAYWIGQRRAIRPDINLTPEQVSDIIFWGAFGVILGGRIGYIIFYDLTHYLAHPITMLQIWRGGMSFHGGLTGVLIAMWLYQYRCGIGFFRLTDFLAPLVPIGLGLGRIGNFINGELFGNPTDLPWGIIFPHGGPILRHPSQLYEFFLEGIVLFIILWLYSRKPRPRRAVSGLFLFGYALFRFLVEFARQPDSQLGYFAGNWLTMGQILSLPMLLAGAGLILSAYHSQAYGQSSAN